MVDCGSERALVREGPTCGAGNLLAYINTLSFRQICQPLVPTPNAYVVERPLLKIWLKSQRQANADKVIPSAPGLVVGEYEL